MRNSIITYVIASIFMVAITTEVSAQNNHNSKEPKEDKKTVKHTPTKVIPSTKVTYKKPSKKVVSVRTLPKKTLINHQGQNYYYDNNKFYTLSRGHYIAIAPKVGFRINVLPPNFRRVHFNNHDYYNANGIFYIQINEVYEVVDPEVGTIVYELPEDYEKVVINNVTYYEYANILYEKIQVDGTRAYEVVGIIEIE